MLRRPTARLLTLVVCATALVAAAAGSAGAAPQVTLTGTFHLLEADTSRATHETFLYDLTSHGKVYGVRFARPLSARQEGRLNGSTLTLTGERHGTTLANARIVPGRLRLQPRAARPDVVGERRVAIILVNFTDNRSTPWTPEDLEDRWNTRPDSVSAFFDTESYHQFAVTVHERRQRAGHDQRHAGRGHEPVRVPGHGQLMPRPHPRPRRDLRRDRRGPARFRRQPVASLTMNTLSGYSVVVALSGTSVSPGAGGAAAWQSPGLTLPVTAAGRVSTASPIVLKNTGSSALTVSYVYLEATNGPDFRIVSNGCASRTLLAGGSCTVTVAFAPRLGTSTGSSATAKLTSVSAGASASATVSGTVA